MNDFIDGDNPDEPIKAYKEKDYSEFRIQVAIVDHVRGRVRKGKQETRGTQPFHGLFITHIYTGRNKDEGFFLKMLGVVAGITDLMAIWQCEGRGFDIGFMEVKKLDGKLSPPQIKFKGFCRFLGIKWALVRSVREAHEQFIVWGLKPTHNAIREPDCRTDKEKFQQTADALWKR